MTFPGGLLDQSAIARLLAQMAPQLQPTPSWNPSADPVQGRMQGLLSQNLSQNPVQGEGPGLLSQGRSTSPGGDPNHEHREGLKGKIRHLLGGDRIDPDIAALLPEDQKQRLLNMSLLGQFWGGGEEKIAGKMLARRDLKEQRDLTAQQKRAWEQIQAMSTQIQDPQQRLEYVARMAASAGLPQGAETGLAAQRLGEKEFAPQRVTWTTTDALVNGKPMKVLRSNQGDLLAPDGTDLRATGATIEPIPAPENFSVVSGATTPQGTVAQIGTRTGTVRDTGLVPNSSRDPQTIRLVENERTLAYNDAVQSWEGLVDKAGKIKDPPGHWDRLATRSEKTNWLASEDGQAYMNNVRKLIRSWVVLVEGKRMSDADARVNELQRSFSFGDKSLVVEGKKQTLQNMKESIEALGKPADDKAALKKTSRIKPANATDAEWAAFLLTLGEKP